MKLSTGDLVVVVGETTNKDGPTEKHNVLSTVVAVGKRDVFVQKRANSSVFSAPISRCIKVPSDSVDTKQQILIPKIGDLVLSMADKFGRIERNMGVLTEIIDKPGDFKMAKILKGEKSEIVMFKSLIVIE